MWVIKYGGNAMIDDAERARVLADIRALRDGGGRPVVVHGGGPFIAAALSEAGEESRFIRGLRVTSRTAIVHVERVLTLLGKRLAAEVGDAVALTGRDARLLLAERVNAELGEVGRMVSVRRALIDTLVAHAWTPVIGCLAVDAAGDPLNVNADEVAGAVAAAVGAPLVLLTNVPGVLDDPSDPSSRLTELRAGDARERIADGRIAGGMIPKVEAALAVLEQGAPACVIADGRVGGELDRVRFGIAGTRILP
jgi:acetylglutamate kinase